jgi:hypothetical protein
MEGNYSKPRLNSVKSVGIWFNDQQTDEEKLTFWSVYGGLDRKNRITSNYHVDDSAKSWEFLKRNLELYEPLGGVFEIFITNKARGNGGLWAVLDLPSASNLHLHTTSINGFEPQSRALSDEITDLKLQLVKMQYQNEIDKLKNGDRKGISGFISALVEHETWNSEKAVQALMFGIEKITKSFAPQTTPQTTPQSDNSTPVTPQKTTPSVGGSYNEDLKKELMKIEDKTQTDVLTILKKVNKAFSDKSEDEIKALLDFL